MKNKGFTLVELMVGMLITMVIMGALVALFSTSVKSQQSGFNQQEAYAQARAVMNDFKTTLRYAKDVKFYDSNGNQISSPTQENTQNSTGITYTSTFYDKDKDIDIEVKMDIHWKDGTGKKQISISKIIDSGTEQIVLFPSTKDIEKDNSAFDGTGNDFPIYITKLKELGEAYSKAGYGDGEIYHVKLPYKYRFIGISEKTDVLETDIAKTDGTSDEVNDVPPILMRAGNLTINGTVTVEPESSLLVFKIGNINGLSNSWANNKFTVLTNSTSNDFITKSNNNVEIMYYDKNDRSTLSANKIEEIEILYSRWNNVALKSKSNDVKTYKFTPSGEWKNDINSSITFNSNQKFQNTNININNSSVSSLVVVNGNNAIYSGNMHILSSNLNTISLKDGTDTGSLILYSSSNVELKNIKIPKEISVLIYAGSDLKITGCELENAIIIANGGTTEINNSKIYGMVEVSVNQLTISGDTIFGAFKGTPKALNVFDSILL